MKKTSNQNPGILSQLIEIKEALDCVSQPDSKCGILNLLDELVLRLKTLRCQLDEPSLQDRIADVDLPLRQVINFLEFAESNEALKAVTRMRTITESKKPKRSPIEIADNLSNAQIRHLLEKDLSKAELNSIAIQRGISPNRGSEQELRAAITRVIDRQDDYERMAGSRASGS